MIRTPDLTSTFDELIKGYYGRIGAKPVLTVEQVVAAYYGRPVRRRRPRWGAPEAIHSRHDDGEVLEQRVPMHEAQAYAVQHAVASGCEEEYVVGGCSSPATSVGSLAPAAPASPTASASPAAPAIAAPVPVSAAKAIAMGDDVSAEYLVDVRDPLAQQAEPAPPGAAASPALAGEPTTTRFAPAAAPSEPAVRTASVEEAELAADMAAILSGQKVYEPSTGELRDRTTSDRESRERAGLVAGQVPHEPEPAPTDGSAPPPGPPTPGASNELAIFDRIAQSMQYANKYDLGTVELENRFRTFDLESEGLQRANEAKAAARTQIEERRPAVDTVGSQDFIADLDAIREQRAAAAAERADSIETPADVPVVSYSSSVATWSDDPERDAACASPGTILSMSAMPEEVSQPFFDTGEHVMAGGDLYPNRLHLGRQPAVAFSYGQLIAMADLFRSVDDMLHADPAELNRVKALVDRSTQFYKGNKANASLDVSNDEWDRATGGRYLRLAEDNSDHFSPNVLFNDSTAQAAARSANNQSSWKAAHMRAIGEAQSFRQRNTAADAFPEWALTINAFGDHFLTDAFASGHLINKDVMIAYFRQNFFNGRSLKPAAKDFFGRVAEKAFVGEVRRRFSALETTDYPVCALGFCLRWHPNINSVDRFKSLLLAAAEQEPTKVANFAIKALHDKLNRDGVEVTNGGGDGTWTTHGDGFMDQKTLGIMRKAVQASIDNVNDRSIPQGTRDFSQYFDKAWKFVPRLTPASQTRLTALVREYTNPASTTLSDAAAEIIRKQVDSLISVLIREGKLKPA